MTAAVLEPVATKRTNEFHGTAKDHPCVRLSFPGPGNYSYGAVCGIVQASAKNVEVQLSNLGGGWDSFNMDWAEALNGAERGECTHFAMLHADITPQPGWLDVLLEEMQRLGAALVSVPVPIKDDRGLMSCGIANPDCNWTPLRRITAKELLKLPETFNEEDFGYPGYPLLHNNGCWIADLRHPGFYQTYANGCLVAFFNFPRQVIRHPETKQWTALCESEDWYFSRKLHELDLPTFITRKVKLSHAGGKEFNNYEPWGLFDQDENTRENWEKVARVAAP